MSKSRATNQTKDGNNISSKLLGANLSDINIEKFRDPNPKKQKYDVGGKLSLSVLKTLTNKFSPSVIFTVTLPCQSISSIDAIGQCCNLMVLNLRQNSIVDITPLSQLTKLRIVDLCNNSLTSIDALQHSKQLVSLQLDGNRIKSLDNLRMLQSCLNLKSLRLQNLGADNYNPVCVEEEYRADVIRLLPQLRRLDCVAVAVMGFSNGKQLELGRKEDVKIELKNVGPFYTNRFPSVGQYMPQQFQEEAGIKKNIATCKAAIQELEVKMRMYLTA